MKKRKPKYLSFDLDTKKLEEYYPKPNWRKAYYDIEAVLVLNGFIHRQGSCYMSKSEMSFTEILMLIDILKAELPWFSKCINKIDTSDIGPLYDLYDYAVSDEKSVDLYKSSGVIISKAKHLSPDNGFEKDSSNKPKRHKDLNNTDDGSNVPL